VFGLKVTIMDQVLEFGSEINDVQQMIASVNQLLGTSKLVVDSVWVDGADAGQDYETYILEHHLNIESIRITTQTMKQLCLGMLDSAVQYIDGAVEELPGLSKLFYTGSMQEAWGKLEYLFEGLQWLNQMAVMAVDEDMMFADQKEYHSFIQALSALMVELSEAVAAKDGTSIGDIVSYEILPMLNNIKSVMTQTLHSEGAA